MANLQTFPAVALGGMVMADHAADPKNNASWDVNGDFRQGFRRCRSGCRLILSEHFIDWRCVWLFRSLQGQLRVLAVGYALKDRTGPSPAYLPLKAGQLLFIVADVGKQYPDDSFVLPSKILGWGKGGLADGCSTPGHYKYTGRLFPYLQRDTILIFGDVGDGVPSFSIAMSDINGETIAGTMPGTQVVTNGFFQVHNAWFTAAGGYSNIGYLTGAPSPSFVWRFDNSAWYTFGKQHNLSSVSADDGSTMNIPTTQEKIPKGRIVNENAVRVDQTMALYSDPETPLNIPWMNYLLADNGENVMGVAGVQENWALIYERSTVLRTSLALGASVPQRVEYGTSAPGTIKTIGDMIVFVGHQGLVSVSPKGSECVSSPALDLLFNGKARSTAPSILGQQAKMLGLPYRVDHTRLSSAVATHDATRGVYYCAVTTEGSHVVNDLIIEWNYKAKTFNLHHGLAFTLGLQNFVLAGQTNYKVWGALTWAAVDTYYEQTGRPVTVFCNGSGVYEFNSGDYDYVALQDTFHPEDIIASKCPIASLRITPPFSIVDAHHKKLRGLRLMLRDNLPAIDGTSLVVVEGERGSAQALTYSQVLAGRDGLREDAAVESGDSDLTTDPTRPHWNQANQVWGHDPTTTQPDVLAQDNVFIRPDYKTVRLPLAIPDVHWMRVAFYELVGGIAATPIFPGGSATRELNLLAFEVVYEPDRNPETV